MNAHYYTPANERSLSQYIFNLQEKTASKEDDVHKEMEQLAERYGDWSAINASSKPDTRERDSKSGKTIVRLSFRDRPKHH